MTRAVRLKRDLYFYSTECAYAGLPVASVCLTSGLVDLDTLRGLCSYRRHLNALRRRQKNNR